MFLRVTREQLLDNKAFVARHTDYVRHATTEQLFLVIEKELLDHGLTHPHATLQEQALRRDAMREGIEMCAEFFMRFVDTKDAAEIVNEFEPLETAPTETGDEY